MDVSAYGQEPRLLTFILKGGTPSQDGSHYNIIAYQEKDPQVLGILLSGPATHGDTVTISVPDELNYILSISDDDGQVLEQPFGIPSLILITEDALIQQDTTGCMDIRVRQYTDVLGLQLFFQWDPQVLTFSSLSSPGLSAFNPENDANVVGDSILLISYFTAFFPGESIPYDSVLFQVCFEAIGEVGDCSPMALKPRQGDLFPEVVISPAGSGDDVIMGAFGVPACLCISDKVSTSENEVSPDILLSMWPQPASSYLYLNIPEDSRVPFGRLTIVNVLGQPVHQEMLASGTQHTISTRHWAEGMYYYTWSAKNGEPGTSGKICIKH
jgi:hypothetical protein